MEEIVKDCLELVKKLLDGEKSGHDYWHAYRVWKLAKYIAEKEGVKDTLVVEVAAILHDIADRKTFGEKKGLEIIRRFLKEKGVESRVIERVESIVTSISFSKGKTPSDIEGRIVQDADRLDALGAIGIARCFAGGAVFNRVIYDPENVEKSSIGHFYEKLLKLKDLMNTETARRIAEKRHKFMEKFLEEFFREWEVEETK